jgi:hypothetical protein
MISLVTLFSMNLTNHTQAASAAGQEDERALVAPELLPNGLREAFPFGGTMPYRSFLYPEASADDLGKKECKRMLQYTRGFLEDTTTPDEKQQLFNERVAAIVETLGYAQALAYTRGIRSLQILAGEKILQTTAPAQLAELPLSAREIVERAQQVKQIDTLLNKVYITTFYDSRYIPHPTLPCLKCENGDDEPVHCPWAPFTIEKKDEYLGNLIFHCRFAGTLTNGPAIYITRCGIVTNIENDKVHYSRFYLYNNQFIEETISAEDWGGLWTPIQDSMREAEDLVHY